MSLRCITKRASLYIGSINSNVVNSLVILTLGSLPTNVNLFAFISTIALYYPPIKSIWFGYRIYSSRSIIPTTNISWVFFIWSLLLFIIKANLRWDILIWLQLIESEIEFEHLSRDLFLAGSTPIELIPCGTLIKFKTFLNKGVLLKSIFCKIDISRYFN